MGASSATEGRETGLRAVRRGSARGGALGRREAAVSSPRAIMLPLIVLGSGTGGMCARGLATCGSVLLPMQGLPGVKERRLILPEG
mmetsp:Transcript_36059/g.88754  ORF Transcript_36059/g.88754 Transcript_36059/m.88754 type:complete len:86 (+) Transcript_36059:3373-3630(+)